MGVAVDRLQEVEEELALPREAEEVGVDHRSLVEGEVRLYLEVGEAVVALLQGVEGVVADHLQQHREAEVVVAAADQRTMVVVKVNLLHSELVVVTTLKPAVLLMWVLLMPRSYQMSLSMMKVWARQEWQHSWVFEVQGHQQLLAMTQDYKAVLLHLTLWQQSQVSQLAEEEVGYQQLIVGLFQQLPEKEWRLEAEVEKTWTLRW